MSIPLLDPPLAPAERVDAQLRAQGFAVIDAEAIGALLGTLPGAAERAFGSWSPSWSRLEADRYLKDGGRYRRRRHGSFVIDGDEVCLAPHRAHWQPVEYNALHGGIERWFEPIEPAIAGDALWLRLLAMLARRADALRGTSSQPWYCEAHQFRIDTTDGIGRPTPEGAHRDGVDLVAVMLVAREGVKGGETRVFDAAGPAGQRFTMSRPWTMLLLDDVRVIHETTPVQPVEAGRGGWRDTLVVTLRAGAFQDP
jgi:hypothetical protein